MKRFLILFPFLFLGGIVIGGENLIKNGDFEQVASDGYIKYFTHFPLYSTSIFIPSNESHRGRCSGKLFTSEKGFIFVSQHGIVLKPGKVYKLTAWVKTALTPVPFSKTISKYKDGALVVIYPELPSGWVGPWPKVGYPNLSVGGGYQNWKKLIYYFKADKEFYKVWLALYIKGAIGTAWFDDISLVECSPDEMKKWEATKPKIIFNKSRNLLYNGSFELTACHDVPDNWGSGIGAPWFYKYQPWEGRIKVIKKDGVDGKNYLQLRDFTIFSKMPIKINSEEKNLVLSFWARCNPFPGKLKVGCIKWKEFNIEEKWKRYILPIENKKGVEKAKIIFSPVSKNAVFDIDAVCLNYGNNPIPYRPSEEETIYKKLKLLLPPGAISKNAPVLNCPFVKKPPKIDGIEDMCWKKALRIDNFHMENGKSPSQRTEVFICRNFSNLYILFNCNEKSMGEIQANILKDDGLVYLDDSVGITINPEPGSGTLHYFKFDINAAGIKSESFNGYREWDCPWKAKVHRGKKKWSVEMSIPLAVLCRSVIPDNVWGINFYRNRPYSSNRKREKSYWVGNNETDFGGLKKFSEEEMIRFCLPAKEPYFLWRNIGSDKIYTILEVKKRKDLKWYLFSKKENKSFSVRGKKFKEIGNKEIIYFPGFSKNAYITGETEKGEVLFFKNIKNPSVSPPFQLFPPQFNYTFVGEKNRVKAKINVFERKPEKITFVIKNKEGKDVFSQVFNSHDAEKGVVLNETFPEGDYILSAYISVGDKKIFSEQVYDYRKLPPSPVEIKIDHWKRMLLKQGKPFIPLAFSLSGGWQYINHLDEIAEKKFNTIFLWSTVIGKPFDTNKAKDVIKRAKDSGLETIITTNHDMKRRPFIELSYDDIKFNNLNIIQSLKDKDGILMWHHMDEVYSYWTKGKPKKESDLIDLYKTCVKEDPYRPHFNNSYYCGKVYGGVKSTDLIHCTSYTIREFDGVSQTIINAREMWKVGEKEKSFLPVGIWLQYYIAHDRLPSFDELNAMVYGCLVEGTRSFAFFSMRPLSDYLWEKTKTLNEEIEKLTPLLYKGTYFPDIKCNNPTIHFYSFLYKRKIYVVAVNISQYPVKAVFQSDFSKLEKVKLMFENRKIRVKNHRYFVDKFPPLTRHIYVIYKEN